MSDDDTPESLKFPCKKSRVKIYHTFFVHSGLDKVGGSNAP